MDIEVCRPDVEALRLAQRFFAPGESQRIAQALGRSSRACSIVIGPARKPISKGRGVGLSFGLERFELLFDNQVMQAQVRLTDSGILDADWSLQSIYNWASTVAGAIAVEGEGWKMQLFDATTLFVTRSPAV